MRILCGIDFVEIARIEKILSKDSDAFIRKCFTDKEIEYCSAKNKARACESFAARFAAKEACGKALGTGIMSDGIKMTDIEVGNDSLGAPFLILHGAAADMADRLGVISTSISLTHDGGLAGAYCTMITKSGD